MTEQITITVDSELARAYRDASVEERRKLDLLISLRLRDATLAKGSIDRVIREISQRAQERGLTPEILDSLLDDE